MTDEPFRAPGYRTDSEILRETAELTGRLDGPVLTGDRQPLTQIVNSAGEAETAAIAEYREWVAAGRPGELTHEQAMAHLLTERGDAGPCICSCGDTFSGLALLETHLDLLGDDTDAHVELAVSGDRRTCRRVALGIRRFRLERGLPIREIGVLLGVSPSTISQIESGKQRTGYLLVKPHVTAARLGISIVELLCPCPRCGYKPPAGYLCQNCGMSGERA